MKEKLNIPGTSLCEPIKDENLVKIAKESTDKFTLKSQYNSLMNKYIFVFCSRMGFDKPEIQLLNESVRINDYWIGFFDIIYAVDENIDEKIFFEWYDFTLEQARCSLENFIKTTGL